MMMAATLRHLDQLLHTVERGRPLNVDESGRLPVRLYGPDGQPLFTEQNPAHVKGEVTLTDHYIEVIKDQSTVDSTWRYWGETVGAPPTQIPRMDVSRYRAVRLICINTTDVQFNLYRGRFYYEPIGIDDQHVMYTPFQNISVPAGAVVILDEEEFPLLGKGGLWAMWRTNSDGTATVGQFRIITLGVLR